MSARDQAMASRLLTLHAAACERQERFYMDPVTGFTVLTEYAHRARGKCCGNACRHCPWDWRNVDPERFEGLEQARQERRERREAGGL